MRNRHIWIKEMNYPAHNFLSTDQNFLREAHSYNTYEPSFFFSPNWTWLAKYKHVSALPMRDYSTCKSNNGPQIPKNFQIPRSKYFQVLVWNVHVISEKLCTSFTNKSFPGPQSFHAHGYVSLGRWHKFHKDSNSISFSCHCPLASSSHSKFKHDPCLNRKESTNVWLVGSPQSLYKCLCPLTE